MIRISGSAAGGMIDLTDTLDMLWKVSFRRCIAEIGDSIVIQLHLEAR